MVIVKLAISKMTDIMVKERTPLPMVQNMKAFGEKVTPMKI